MFQKCMCDMTYSNSFGSVLIETNEVSGREAPWPLALAQKRPPDRETNNQKMTRIGATHREGEVET